jgi:hypothetical protein
MTAELLSQAGLTAMDQNWIDKDGNGHVDGTYGSAGVYSQAIMTGSDFDADMEAQEYDSFEEFKI